MLKISSGEKTTILTEGKLANVHSVQISSFEFFDLSRKKSNSE